MTTTQNPHSLPAAPDIDLGGGYTQPPLPAFQTPVGAFAPTCATPGCTWYADELALWDTDYLYDTPEGALQAEWTHDTDGHWWCPSDSAKRTCEVRGHDLIDDPSLPNLLCVRCTAHVARPTHREHPKENTSMSSITIRPTGSDNTHRVLGSIPGWAYCDAWIQTGEKLPEDAPIACPKCAAMAAAEAAPTL